MKRKILFLLINLFIFLSYGQLLVDETLLKQGCAPIVLYNSDIRQLKIKEIAIKDTIDLGESYRLPYTFGVYFDKMGLFNSFSLYPIINERVELLSCSMQSNSLPTIEDEEYLYENFYHSDSIFGKIQLNFHISSSLNRDDNKLKHLSKIKILPFFGTNGYVYIDCLEGKKYFLNNNTINYSIIDKYNDEENYYHNYGILKRTKSDTTNVVLYEIADKNLSTRMISRRTINTVQKDTNVQYYYYGENPLQAFYRFSSEDEEGNYMPAYYHFYVYFEDNIYNHNRWLGYSESYNEFETEWQNIYSMDNLEQFYEECEKIVNKSFSNQNVTKVSKKYFLINGRNGYDYLLESYNNRKILVKEKYEDENGNFIPSEYKLQKEIVELKELPNKIIVQLTLTDFWYIQLTE